MDDLWQEKVTDLLGTRLFVACHFDMATVGATGSNDKNPAVACDWGAAYADNIKAWTVC